MKLRVRSRDETLALGEKIGAKAPPGAVLALRGGLGVGKTTLAKGIGRGLGIADEIGSPTYTIINEYSGRLEFYHIDAYRLHGEEDFKGTGAAELLGSPGSLSLVEWSERIPEAFDQDTVFLEIRMLDGDEREFLAEGAWLEEALS
ncbi:MAG TPA: tRNA (adenosine(37)-N6)-threonylcarbamoyltransferase complex ATPase subunit type 1 TsaE [Rectinemataceae bacterium]